MSESLVTGLVTIALAITGVAVIATLVSRNAQTPAVLQAAGTSFSGSLSAALSPVTGATNNPLNQFSLNGASYIY